MIVILRPGAQKARVEALMSQIKQQGVDIHYSQGATETILGLVGDTTHVDKDWLRASDIVEDVRRVSEPYKLANRRFHPKDTHVNVCGRAIGEGTFTVIAGPCSVESREQLVSIAEDVKRSGATCLRGGALRPPFPVRGAFAYLKKFSALRLGGAVPFTVSAAHTNSQLKCLTERIRFFVLTKLSEVRRTGGTLNGTRQSQSEKDGARIKPF